LDQGSSIIFSTPSFVNRILAIGVITINTIKVIISESRVIIRIKGEHLLYSKISGGMIGYGWRNVCYVVSFPPGEYLLYSKVSGGKVYYRANIPRGKVYYRANIPRGKVCYAEYLLYDTGITNFGYNDLIVINRGTHP
jgi:hypothetical protein